METKLFLIEEHKETIFEGSEIEKWKSLVAELGLTEQAKLIEGNKSPLPFPVMTEAQNAVYSVILDTKTEYKKFQNEAIPLSVLSLIAFCEKEHHFEKIEIWYSRQNPDPLVVGKNYPDESSRKNNYEWYMIPSLIAQWGAKIKPMDELILLYDEYEKNRMLTEYENNLSNHKRKMDRFKFQGGAFIPETHDLPFN
jgi:hypothetical protein